MIRVAEPWNPLLMWAGPGPPSLSYIHIRLIDEALFQSLYRPFGCGRHTHFYVMIVKENSNMSITMPIKITIESKKV
jgi:hypothetical protein